MSSTTYALALPDARPGRPMLYGTRAQLAVGNGDVEGYLALASCDKRAGTANYALRIVNQSAHSLRARMTCAQLRGEPVLAYPLDVQVAPFSISETLLPIRLGDVGPYDRAIVQVTGGDVAFSLEAPAPPRSARRRRWIAAAAGTMALTLGCAFAAAASTPHIALLAAPVRAFAGRAVDVPYEFGGWASMQYALQTRDGRQLSAGLANVHAGTLHFNVPPAAGRAVLLSVDVAGPFGKQTLTRTISLASSAARASAPRGTMTARIAEFALATPFVHAGDALKVTYATTAQQGELWLLDDTGRLWARAALTAAGYTVLKVPQAAAGRQMRAVLHAQAGTSNAVASLEFLVLPGALNPDSKAAPQVADAVRPTSMTLSTERAAPGDVITVALTGTHGDARITMTDTSGNSIEQGDVSASQDAVTLTAPNATSEATYYVMASITQGVGEQTIVRKLIVAPR